MSFWHSATFSNDGTQDSVLRRVGRRNAAALPRHGQARMGRRRALHDRERQDALQELLQDAGAADVVRELRRAQRIAHPDSGARSDGAGLVSGRDLGVRLDRRREARRRSRIFDRGPVDATRLITGGSWSVYWYNGLHRELGDRARARHLRAAAERAHLAERDRRREDRQVGLPERAGTAQVRVAGRASPSLAPISISSSAGAVSRRQGSRRPGQGWTAPRSCRASRASRRSGSSRPS